MIPIDLSGSAAVVTGGSGGIGSDICLRLAEAGAHVRVVYRSDDQRAESVVDDITRNTTGSAEAVQADLSVQYEIDELFTARLSRCDILVNAAGVYPSASIESMDPSTWDDVMASNVSSLVQCTRAAAPVMARSGGGSIINIASLSATRPAFEQSHYNASKAAVVSFTESAACEFARHGIRVNAVSPGLINRPGLESQWPEGVTRYVRRCPLQRIGTGRDVSNACLFLASQLSGWITGQNLLVDGGISAVEAY